MIIIQIDLEVYGNRWAIDEPNNNLADSESFKSKIEIIGNTDAGGNMKDTEIAVP